LAHLVACIRTDDEKLQQAYSVAAKDIIPYIGGENYKRIKGTCKELAAAFAETEEPDPDGPHPIFTAQPFFTRIRYKKGVITATFNPFMQPYLLELKGCFTVYNLTEYLSLPSLYSQRIFEITKSLANSKDGEAIISMADLHRFLDSPKSFQANFKDFRRFVLEKAHKDITEKTSFRFEWEPVKVGRSVEKIRFIFSGGKKALAQKEQKKAKEEKRQRLTNQRFIRAVECAKAKGGDCRTMDNVRIVCKLCREKGICESLSSTRPHVVKQGSLLS
jgi:plasmid replication initiation protein